MANPKCLMARGKLAQFTSSLKESPTAEKAGTLVKAGYLASIKTTERNVFGNLTFGGVEYLASRPIAVATDYLQSVMRSAATFGRVKPHEFRQIANNLSVGGLTAGGRGIRQGVADAVTLMRTGIDPTRLRNSQLQLPGMDQFELGEVTFKSRTLDRATKAVFNVLEAQDKPFYGFAFQTSLYGRARLLGIREGVSGKALSSRIDELLAAPTEEMMLGAHADAMYATFKNPTALSDMATSLRQGVRQRLAKAPPGRRIGLSAASVLMDITIPFTKVASAIVNAGIDYSPAGFAKALIQAADKDPRVQAQLQRQLARATLGTGLTMLGYSMYGNGTLTGSHPTSASERKTWEAAGKRANSVLIGGKWRSITWLGPLAIPMLLGANIRRFSDQGEEKSAGETAAFAVGSIGKTMTEQSYMQGVSNLINAFNDTDGRAAAAIAGMIPIPALVGQVATAIDPVARATQGPLEKAQARIPFASKLLPAKVDPFGEEIQKTSGGIRGAAESLLDFTSPSTDKSTDLTRELERLQVGVSGVGSTYQVQGVKQQRTPADVRVLTREIGPQMKERLEALIQEPMYQRADDDDRRKQLRKAMDQVKKPVYKRIRRDALEDRIAARLQARGL